LACQTARKPSTDVADPARAVSLFACGGILHNRSGGDPGAPRFSARASAGPQAAGGEGRSHGIAFTYRPANFLAGHGGAFGLLWGRRPMHGSGYRQVVLRAPAGGRMLPLGNLGALWGWPVCPGLLRCSGVMVGRLLVPLRANHGRGALGVWALRGVFPAGSGAAAGCD